MLLSHLLTLLAVVGVKAGDNLLLEEEVLLKSEELVQEGEDASEIEKLMFDNFTQPMFNLSESLRVEEDAGLPSCQRYNHTGEICEPCFDGYLIFPPTPAGQDGVSPCPSVEGLPKFTGQAIRVCHENGSWASTADYSVCIAQLEKHINKEIEKKEEKNRTISVLTNSVYIFLGGFGISNITMITALCIFARCRHLRCLRNLIHSQLLLGMTLKNFVWAFLVSQSLQQMPIFDKPIQCKIFFTIYKFLHMSQYSWMFIEGLYLFIVVFNALFTSILKFKHCMLIGWGTPAVVMTVSTLINYFTSDDKCWHAGYITAANGVETVSVSLLLLVNVIFMSVVIYTLVRKLQNSSLDESKQYRKAVKATMILVPLLGGTYIMLFFSPDGTTKTDPTWYYFNAIVQSTQGFVVALVYCFLNGEVRMSIAKSHRRWKDEKTLPSAGWWPRRRRSSYTITRSKDFTTETDTTCQYSSRRNSRRVSEDTVSSRRGSHIPDSDISANKPLRKASPLTFQHQLLANSSRSCVLVHGQGKTTNTLTVPLQVSPDSIV